MVKKQTSNAKRADHPLFQPPPNDNVEHRSSQPPSDNARKKTSVYLRTDHVQWLLDYQASYFDRTKDRVTKNQLIDLAMDLLIDKCEGDMNFVSARIK